MTLALWVEPIKPVVDAEWFGEGGPTKVPTSVSRFRGRMKSFGSGLAVRIMVLTVAMLSAIGAWEIYKGAGLPALSQVGVPGYVGVPAGTPLDHFTRYTVRDRDDDKGFAATVAIKNQFEERVVKVKDDERLLCAPTAKVPLSVRPTVLPLP